MRNTYVLTEETSDHLFLMFLFARALWFYQNDKQEKLVEKEKNEKLKKKRVIKQQ